MAVAHAHAQRHGCLSARWAQLCHACSRHGTHANIAWSKIGFHQTTLSARGSDQSSPPPRGYAPYPTPVPRHMPGRGPGRNASILRKQSFGRVAPRSGGHFHSNQERPWRCRQPESRLGGHPTTRGGGAWGARSERRRCRLWSGLLLCNWPVIEIHPFLVNVCMELATNPSADCVAKFAYFANTQATASRNRTAFTSWMRVLSTTTRGLNLRHLYFGLVVE